MSIHPTQNKPITSSQPAYSWFGEIGNRISKKIGEITQQVFSGSESVTISIHPFKDIEDVELKRKEEIVTKISIGLMGSGMIRIGIKNRCVECAIPKKMRLSLVPGNFSVVKLEPHGYPPPCSFSTHGASWNRWTVKYFHTKFPEAGFLDHCPMPLSEKAAIQKVTTSLHRVDDANRNLILSSSAALYSPSLGTIAFKIDTEEYRGNYKCFVAESNDEVLSCYSFPFAKFQKDKPEIHRTQAKFFSTSPFLPFHKEFLDQLQLPTLSVLNQIIAEYWLENPLRIAKPISKAKIEEIASN